MNPKSYNTLVTEYKDYIDTVDSLYRLDTIDENEISALYKQIKANLIETKILTPEGVRQMISRACFINSRSLKGYLQLGMIVRNEYHTKDVTHIPKFFDYFTNKEYGVIFNERNKRNLYKFREKEIVMAIMNDDKDSLVRITGNQDFNPNEKHDMILNPNIK
ncbi:hypothetical protein TVAG_303550 [Trichomonas vaginalis G3]|uniref:DUF3447 domain-containing protein n=1 Tax=Trichomonas vaginalis (strain ATCC PRA-98 / G3) TaxID=412133 RepID=A2DR37_TRIV3|nr:protein of unknown function (DUF3447) [Trichomonas vaginalis G3]EAY17136.1 hypothetical protein TVAG_303550 [Trichomonas vaginalis G3]KAI5508852.1 protein of unknown function (DUF3447) [Trichomonas vaginalis G3]|eukprot:XP_001329359.1 hypothetical protein [Trichomonas vaginalis G3]